MVAVELVTKLCPRCGRTLSGGAFYSRPERADGLSYRCVECSRAMALEAKARRRRRMGESAFLADQRERVAASRERNGPARDRQYAAAYRVAVRRLVASHRDEFDRLLLLAKRGELDHDG